MKSKGSAPGRGACTCQPLNLVASNGAGWLHNWATLFSAQGPDHPKTLLLRASDVTAFSAIMFGPWTRLVRGYFFPGEFVAVA